MAELRRSVALSYGYSDDYTNVSADRLELWEDPSDLSQYWRIALFRGSKTIGYRMYAADGCRVLTADSYGRPLVHPDSKSLFVSAIDHSGLWGYEHNRRYDKELSICNHLYSGNGALDYSTLDYCGDFQFKDPETATFLPAGKPALRDCTNGENWSKFHQTQKIGKAVRYVLDCCGVMYQDHHIEAMVNYIKAANTPLEFLYTSQTGKDISDIYDTSSAEGNGSLNSSCMRGYGEYYEDLDSCPDVDLIYTLDPEGRLTSRALLWTTRRGSKILDRIYGSDSTIQAYKELAKEKGWYYKEYQSYDSTRQFINPDGDAIRSGFAINIDLDDSINNSRCPYLDTWKFYSVEQQILTNDLDLAQEVGGNVYELRCTNGEAELY
jgi:hypothetical protein